MLATTETSPDSPHSRNDPWTGWPKRMGSLALVLMLALLIGWHLAELLALRNTNVSLAFAPSPITMNDVQAGEVIHQRVSVKNFSNAPVTLVGSQRSCGCIAIEEFPIVVQPQSEQFLELKISIPTEEGPFSNTVKIFTDREGLTSKVIEIIGNVK